MTDAPKTSRIDALNTTVVSAASDPHSDVLRPLHVQSTGTKRTLSATVDDIVTPVEETPNGPVEGDSAASATTTTSVAPVPSAPNAEKGKRSRFVLRPSIVERFQRCGMDIGDYAQP